MEDEFIKLAGIKYLSDETKIAIADKWNESSDSSLDLLLLLQLSMVITVSVSFLLFSISSFMNLGWSIVLGIFGGTVLLLFSTICCIWALLIIFYGWSAKTDRSHIWLCRLSILSVLGNEMDNCFILATSLAILSLLFSSADLNFAIILLPLPLALLAKIKTKNVFLEKIGRI